MDSTSQPSNLPTEKYWHPKSVRTLSGSPVDLWVSSTLNTWARPSQLNIGVSKLLLLRWYSRSWVPLTQNI